jgi:hypothetical protein
VREINGWVSEHGETALYSARLVFFPSLGRVLSISHGGVSFVYLAVVVSFVLV